MKINTYISDSMPPPKQLRPLPGQRVPMPKSAHAHKHTLNTHRITKNTYTDAYTYINTLINSKPRKQHSGYIVNACEKYS